MIDIEIDGKKVQVKEGSMIIEAADDAGIHIPRFCYHKKLSIAANCRMCLVEVEKAPKPLPACATPVTPEMKIHTQSDVALAAQKSVMEFLLINHPLDCPICDQGGQCELQDVAMGYGKGVSRYTEGKRAVEDEDLGSLIATDMTRCIHCTRCVRFGTEVAGLRELGLTGRGEDSKIGTYIKHSLRSEMSGNIIDVCPVGALTSKPFRFSARAWELQQHESIAPHDCIGSNVQLHVRRGEVMRVVPEENENINEVWLSDRDRFSYQALNSDDRIKKPMVKRDGQWQEVEWVEALNFIAERLNKVKSHHSADQIGAIISPSATLEEMHLLQKWIRGLGSANIDHRLHQADFRDQEQAPAFPQLPLSLNELEDLNTIFLVGSDIQREQPIANHRLRKAQLNDAKIISLNPLDFSFNHEPHAEKIIVNPLGMVTELASIFKSLLTDNKTKLEPALQKLIKPLKPTKQHQQMGKLLQQATNSAILMGAIVEQHPDAAVVKALVAHIAALTDSKQGQFTTGANAAGAWLSGCVPHRLSGGEASHKTGLNISDMFSQQLKAYVLFNVEPELDCANPQVNTKALKAADFVVSLSPFQGGVLNAHADVILPIAAFTETPGSFINIEGRLQRFVANVKPLGEARPGWKVLRVLANACDIPGFDYVSIDNITEELAPLMATLEKGCGAVAPFVLNELTEDDKPALTRITAWPMYRLDNIVRRAQALQESLANEQATININQNTANNLQLEIGSNAYARQNGTQVELAVVLDDRVPDNCVYIATGFSKTAKLGASFAAIEINAKGE